MEKLIILLIISFSIVNAQDNEPTPWNFIWGYSTTPRVFEPDSFQQTTFLTGFQWSGSTKMNNALGNNSTTGKYCQIPTATVLKPINWIFQPTWLDDTDYMPGYFGAVMMQYEPTLPVDSTNFGNILRPEDPADPIFGFQSIKGTVLTNSTDPNYSRLILYKNASYVDSTVLSDIYPVPNFDSETDGGQTDHYPGKMWYLTINLRRLKPSLETIKDDSLVLSIKIPYTRWDDTTNYIKFDSIPSNIPNDTTQLNYFEDRGIAQNIIKIYPAIDSISITRKMLPISSDGYENITICAEFKTNGDDDFNKIFSRDSTTGKEIKSFDIEVNYFGHTGIAIDYVRIENVNAHYLLRGVFDSLGTMPGWPYSDARGNVEIVEEPGGAPVQINTIKDIIQSAIDSLKAKSNNWAGAKLFRLYYQDIEVPWFYWWGGLRYANKFSNGMFIASDGPMYPELYEYYTKCPNRYFGLKFSQSEALLAQPYFRATGGYERSMNYKYGFWGQHPEDSLTSGYETFFVDSNKRFDPLIYKHINTYSIKDYKEQLALTDAFQSKWELGLYDKFFDTGTDKYIYSDNGWYTNLFIGSIINLESDTLGLISNPTNQLAVIGGLRPKTGEEIRTLFMTNLIMGAKGIFYDREESVGLPGNGLLGLGDGTKDKFFTYQGSKIHNYSNFS